MSTLASVLAISWEPELRGVLIVIIAVTVLCGSVYMILGTNLGARLGFLVAFAGLAGWMMMMGIIWMIYGIGMQGPMPSWKAMEGRTVIQDTSSLTSSGVLDHSIELPEGASFAERGEVISAAFEEEGWETLDAASPEYGQAFAAAQTFIEEEEALTAGGYVATAVYDVGGDRWPKIGESIDFLAFMHEPRYVVVEVAPTEPTRSEAGRAPASAVIQEDGQRQFVYMVRDLGARRQPAQVLTIGSGLIFGALCWLMHRRDQTVERNLAAPAPAS